MRAQTSRCDRATGRAAGRRVGAVAAGTAAVAALLTTAPTGTDGAVGLAASASRTVAVSEVTDGDTFDTADGQTVRVLGIDSCETDTAGGRDATTEARQLLAGQTVTLVTEPGVDTDRFGRQLRYVQLPSSADYGLTMVDAAHTGVYDGDNDANLDYLAQLRAADNGRSC
ncbi:thermonuclease family protein [Pseudonocardia parietis]|uniref:Endonuclease YncB(Thermonuclease family) n=1 Tax=Pseudonocardia parietis TaxID=570936 RepID=A0ABS4W5R1_9PSEU|nr:thermonuclease family protein [Pseudonocardia parietis]MBP2371562.1 endonuclease YncB(thermonuclease family) [Pseudonocardia parietis]